MSVVIFLGPTLPRDEAAGLLPATYLPPAQQGDIYRAVRNLRPRVIGLIDGRFLDTGAVWHREILWALSQGVHVFGAASMGALRAAELAPFGMRGVGRIFDAFRDGTWPDDPNAFEDDDEVAVIHAPAALRGGALSDAMVDLRATLDAAVADGVVTSAEARRLIEALKRMPFGERSFAVLPDAAARLLDATAAQRLTDWLPGGKVACKRLDAVAMLRAVAGFLAIDPTPFVAGFTMERPLFWQRFVAGCAADDADVIDPAARRVLDRLRRDTVAWHCCARAALGRLSHADEDVAAAEPYRALDRFRRDRGLWHRNDLLDWMMVNGLDEAGLEGLLRRDDALARLIAEEPSGMLRAMADHLRLTGAFAALLIAAEGEAG